METMEISVPAGMVKKEWFTTTEFAAGVGISKRTLNLWIQRHPDFVKNFCQNISKGKIVRYLIFWKGLSEYIAQKSQSGTAGNIMFPIRKAKSVLAEKANQTIETENSQDPMIANLTAMIELRKSQLAMTERMDHFENKLAEVTEVLTTPVDVTAGQRQFLNERVRKYCISHDLPFHIVWRQIHEHVGIPAVHLYKFKHYSAALKYIRKMYDETGLVW